MSKSMGQIGVQAFIPQPRPVETTVVATNAAGDQSYCMVVFAFLITRNGLCQAWRMRVFFFATRRVGETQGFHTFAI